MVTYITQSVLPDLKSFALFIDLCWLDCTSNSTMLETR